MLRALGPTPNGDIRGGEEAAELGGTSDEAVGARPLARVVMALGAPWREDSGPTTDNGSSSGWIRIEGEGSPPDNRVAQAPTKPSMAAMERRLAVLGHESGNAADAQLLAFEDTLALGSIGRGTYAYLTNTARHEGRVPDTVIATG